MTTPVRIHLLASLIALAAACSGGKDGATPATYTLIDDMEADVNQLAWQPPEGAMPGWWWASVDCTQAERIAPPPYFVDPEASPYATLPAPHETFPGVVSTNASRLRTTAPLEGVWGAGLVASLAATGRPSTPGGGTTDGAPCRQGTDRDFPSPTVDLTAYAGITFWAKAEPGGERTVRLQLNDSNTDPRGGACNAADPDDESRCYNGYGTWVPLTDTFERYTIDFASLAQDPRWGFMPNPSALDLSHVYSMNFTFDAAKCVVSDVAMCAGGESPPVAFDFWLDDVYFVNR